MLMGAPMAERASISTPGAQTDRAVAAILSVMLTVEFGLMTAIFMGSSLAFANLINTYC